MNCENGTKVLVRKRKGRMVAGSAPEPPTTFASTSSWSGNHGLLSVLTGGAGILAYLAGG